MTTGRFCFPLAIIVLLLVDSRNSFAEDRQEKKPSKSSTGPFLMAETDKETRIRDNLENLLVEVGVHVAKTVPRSTAQAHNVIRVRWQSSLTGRQMVGANLERQPVPGVVTLLALSRRDGTLPRERSVELSANQILIAALDQNAGLRWWRLLLDPRLVRSEVPDPAGGIHGENYYLPKVDFVVECPEDSAIRELRFYHPTWTGERFRLTLLSTLPLR